LTYELVLLVLIVAGLAAASALVMTWIMRIDAREKKLQGRMAFVVAPLVRVVDTAEEQVSLAKSSQKKSEKIKEIAAQLINVDLNQAETYPVKWWLLPPVTIAISWVIVEIASHPLGHLYLLLLTGWPFISIFVTKFAFNWLNNKRNSKLLEQFPDALNSIVRSVRVGIPMAEALRTVSRDALEPTRAEFLILADKVSIGIPLDVALRELALRIKLTEYQFFATALTLQARSGGGITQTLETLAEVIRKRVGLKARGYALTAEARTSVMILALLPCVAGGGLFIMQRSYADMLFDTKSGQSCLGAAILLMGAGLGLIQYMINNVLK
jgi:tight adherence protein B